MKLEIYRRADGKWAWRLKAGNGQVVATDGGQGYENLGDVADITREIFSGSAVEVTLYPQRPTLGEGSVEIVE